MRLRPGVRDALKHRGKSIVGRYLEHSRIYSFGCGDARKLYISSGDLMTRSTQRRIEIAAPIHDPDIKAELVRMLDTMLADNVKARVLRSDGTYVRKESDGEPINAQELFYK